MDRFLYTGPRTKEISFPLGGLGTGCLGLAGNGRLIDWEIFNRPNKGSVNGFSHFAIRAEAGGKVLDARVLHGDLHPPYSGSLDSAQFGSFGHGVRREYLTGLPHFREVSFRGEFPIATLSFREPRFPGRVTLTAFNPFLPHNDRDSGLPAAFFEFAITNPTRRRLTYTLAATLANPLPAANLNRVHRRRGLTLLSLRSDSLAKSDPAYGDLTLATDAAEVSWQEYWFRAGVAWFQDLEIFWHDFCSPGPLRNRRYPPREAGQRTHGTLAVRVSVAPGKAARVRFVIAWHFPNCENYWDREARARCRRAGIPPTWRNYYATLFPDSAAVASYALTHWDRLWTETRRFKEALFSSDLPPAVLDAVSANLSILKSPTILRLEDGTCYGWEGCHPRAGCCEGSCTHVWNYAQALAFLFPALERSMREADYRYNQRPDGGMAFRLLLPLGSGRSSFRPCADGQFGGVLRAYRDWKISGNTDWLRSLWPAIKRAIAFSWAPTNEDRWDPGKTGVLHGRQHHTLDMELFGPNSWLTGMYLAALKAGAEMAEALGEPETAADYRALFARGKAWADRHLFNGEYYHQLVDLDDRSVVDRFGAAEAYWDPEHREIMFQIGEGCAVDQVLGQWHADLYGLGEVFHPRQTRQALRAIFRHNFQDPIRNLPNPCRVFCVNDEAGLIICSWPPGRRKPLTPVPYAQETFHGCEYAVASHMIYRGLVRQGLRIVEAVRARYDGERRNPWNEFECGSNYARSLASYALLLSFSRFHFDLTRGLIGFDPVRLSDGRFRCFWSVGEGWGRFSVEPRRVVIEVLGGALGLRTLELPFLRGRRVQSVVVAGRPRRFAQTPEAITLLRPCRLARGQRLTLTLVR